MLIFPVPKMPTQQYRNFPVYLHLVRDLADKGVAVILISHNMNDVLHVADRIAALYLGQMAAIVDRSAVTQTQIVELITAGRSGDLGLTGSTLSTNGAAA